MTFKSLVIRHQSLVIWETPTEDEGQKTKDKR
jgi:hypothetical protein